MFFILLISICYLILPLIATPVFNEVNGYDLDGNRCSLPTYQSYPCPVLCVSDISMCPPALRPTCNDPNLVYCMDGQCRSSCPANLISPCHCNQPNPPTIYPCLRNKVKIDHFIAENKTLLSMDKCSQSLGLNIQPWHRGVPKELMWGSCPDLDRPGLTLTEPVFLALYGFYGSCLFLLVAWSLYKSIYEKTIKKRTLDIITVDSSLDEKELDLKSCVEEQDGLVIKAYRRSVLGDITLTLFILQTFGQVGYMTMMTKDYYMDYALFNGDAVIQSCTFMALWYIFFFWFAGITLFKSRLPNFFRLQCTYGKGDHVQIEKEHQGVIFLQDQSNQIMEWVRKFEQLAKQAVGHDRLVTTAPLERTQTGSIYFVYQCTRYVYQSGQFIPHNFDLGHSCADLAQLDQGLTESEAAQREELIGPNFIQVHVPSFLMGLLHEFTSFFYIYQFTILWLFYYYSYWQVGIADTFVIMVSAIVKVVVRLRSEQRIKTMAEFTDNVTILRDGTWKDRSTADLIPGDVFKVDAGRSMPCDGILLTGQVVVDESSLTGEPLPIRKFAIRADDTSRYDRLGAGKISTLFAGTTLSSVQPSTLALATQTGTSTDKGQLIKKILFPTKVSFVFDEQIKIVILILLSCGMVVLGLAIWLYARGTSAWFYAMFAISQLVSPLLPAALVVGQSVASGRLREKQIYCVDLPRILMAGKVQIFCFDKTGTLTKEGLEYYGAQAITQTPHGPQLDELVHQMTAVPRLMQIGLATCHAVTTLDGQYIGNPVDIEMFKSSQWTLADKSDYIDTFNPPLGTSSGSIHILQRFEFVHARMSMSVAVLDSTTNKIHIFVKGAYEKIKDLSTSIPADYDKTTADLARQGCYVLAISHREIDLEEVGGMTAFSQWNRDEMEQDIEFMGLIVFKNQLKPDTTEYIGQLKAGATRTVMITGDTALTGVYIARQCGMALPDSQVLLGELDGDQVRWKDVDSPETPVNVNQRHDRNRPVELAVTGKAFDWLVEHDLIRDYLMDIRVFARMTPNGKVQCIQLHMERGITAMTGDGGNDCGALRAAHVGMAMSDAEASIVSPFSTSIRSVKSCVELVRQGRAALATSITGYKYLILYGQVMMMLKIFTFYFSISLSQNIWIAVDVFITVLLTWAVSQSQAAETLAPQRPTAQLLGPQVLSSTIGLVVINWSFLIGAFCLLYQQPWFRCNEFDAHAVDMSKWWLLADNYEGQVLAFVCVFQFINNAAVQNWGYRFRQAFHRNYILVGLWLTYFAVASFLCLADPNWLGCAFRFNCGTRQVMADQGYFVPAFVEDYNTPLGHNVMPVPFRWKLWGLIVGNMLAGMIWERGVILGPVHDYLARTFPVRRLVMVY